MKDGEGEGGASMWFCALIWGGIRDVEGGWGGGGDL